MLEISGLSIYYWERPAVRDLSLRIAPGEVVGLLGESGCGKTTLANCILGMVPLGARFAGGSIRFRGEDLLRLKESRMREIRGAAIGWIAQEPASALNPVLRAGDQVAEVIRAHRPWNMRRIRAEAAAILEQCAVSDIARIYRSYPHQLSGGEQQRVVIAQALACRPPLVVADEPTASLDYERQDEILGLLNRLKSELNVAMLFISHAPAVVGKIADRILVMYAGRIVEQGPARELLANPLHPYTRALLAREPAPYDLNTPESGCAFAPRCPQREDRCGRVTPDLIGVGESRQARCVRYV